MALKTYKLGELIEPSDERNSDGKYGIDNVKGISIQKIFIETKADMAGVSLTPYLLVKPDYFAYVTVTSRNGEKITLAHNKTPETYIVSSSYVVFRIKKADILLSDYLFIYFNRPEFDRFSRFNSWGSARETFSWADLCDIDITLPDKVTQQKYVDIYESMVANQKSYEKGLDDLKLTCDAFLDKLKKECPKKEIGKLLTEVDRRNLDGQITSVKGINIEKKFIDSVADTNGVDLKKYKLVLKKELAYSGMQTGRDKCVRIALQDANKPIIISPAYSVFQVDESKILPEYLMIWFSRTEIDRLGWFYSDASIRANLDNDRLFEMQIPIPDISVQRSIADIYKVYTERKRINEQLKQQIKDICPILIKGSLEE